MWTVAQLAADLAAGKTSSRELVEQALARIHDPAGEGSRALLKVYADGARADADYADRLRKAGARRSPVDGLPVSLKDLFDVAGDVTGDDLAEEAVGHGRATKVRGYDPCAGTDKRQCTAFDWRGPSSGPATCLEPRTSWTR